MSMVTLISRPRALPLDFTVPLNAVGDDASIVISPVIVSGFVQLTVASITVRVFLVTVCVQSEFGRCCMNDCFSNFSFVMHDFVVIGLDAMFFIMASICAFCSGDILLVSTPAIMLLMFVTEVVSHKPILTSSIGACAAARVLRVNAAAAAAARRIGVFMSSP